MYVSGQVLPEAQELLVPVIIHGLHDDDLYTCMVATEKFRRIPLDYGESYLLGALWGVVEHAVKQRNANAMRWPQHYSLADRRWSHVVFHAAIGAIHIASKGKATEDELRTFLHYCDDKWISLPPHIRALTDNGNTPRAEHLGTWILGWLNADPARPLQDLISPWDEEALRNHDMVWDMMWRPWT